MVLKNFFVFEGCEGSGKSTQAALVAEELMHIEHPWWRKVWLTKEPGGTSYGQRIRTLVLFEKPDEGIDPLTEFLLFEADRREHIKEIQKRHEAGDSIICDRFSFSTFAYQGYGRGLFKTHRKFMEDVDTAVRGSIYPRLIFLFDQDIKIGLSRKHHQGEENQFEKETLEFHQRVRDGYLELARVEGFHNWRHIRADRPIENIHAEVMQILLSYLQQGEAPKKAR